MELIRTIKLHLSLNDADTQQSLSALLENVSRYQSTSISLGRLRDHLQKGVKVSLVYRDRDY